MITDSRRGSENRSDDDQWLRTGGGDLWRKRNEGIETGNWNGNRKYVRICGDKLQKGRGGGLYD